MSKPMFFIKGFLPRLIFIATCCSILFACTDQAVHLSNEATPLKNKQNPLLIYPEEIHNKEYTATCNYAEAKTENSVELYAERKAWLTPNPELLKPDTIYKNGWSITDFFDRTFIFNAEPDHGGAIMHKENNKHAIPLLLSLQEISKNDYKEKYGQASLESDPVTAVAENLAKVTLNKIVLEKDKLKPGDLLSIRTFNNTDYIVIIDNITYGSRVLSIIGKIGKTDYGYLNLSVADNLVLAYLNLTELNYIYLLRYNHYSGNYYLFEAPYDKIEKPVRY